MEASALRYTGGIGLHGRSPLLRLQSDERLISLVRRGSPAAFEVLVSRYQSRLLAFCRHLLGSREDAEDVLQEALAAAFNAILADDRPINVRPWLYRIARNRCLNHLRRIQAVGVDSMDVHLSEHGTSTADKVHKLEEFWMLVGDIQDLPETQKTALVLREMDALSYEQIAEAMDTTIPSVKSLLVRARVSLAEAAEARMLSCEEVRIELAEAAEGLRKKQSPVVRRHLRSCERCSVFQVQLKETSKALTALLPIGPLVLLKKLVLAHIGHSAGTGGAGAGAAGAGAAGVGSTAAAGSALVGSGAGSVLSVGIGTIATKAAAGLAAAALVTAGAVEVSHDSTSRAGHAPANSMGSGPALIPLRHIAPPAAPAVRHSGVVSHARIAAASPQAVKPASAKATVHKPAKGVQPTAKPAKAAESAPTKPAAHSGRTQSQTETTVLASGQGNGGTATTSASDQPSTTTTTTATSTGTSTTAPTDTTGQPTTTTSAPTTPTNTTTGSSGTSTTPSGGETPAADPTPPSDPSAPYDSTTNPSPAPPQ